MIGGTGPRDPSAGPCGDTERPVLVTGATGFVGSHVTRALAGRGRHVRAFVRATSKRRALDGLPVEIVEGDVLDPASLRAAMAGCATVFHCVVDPRFWLTDQTPIRRNNIDGLVNAMDAALACGIERFVFTSTMGTLGRNPRGPVTEDMPFDWGDIAPPYILARLEAETTMLRYCRERGLPGVALCVANTYGPEDYQPTPHNALLWQVAAGRMPVAVDVGQPTVDIRDVAEAALTAEAQGRIGERYIIANEYVRNRDFYRMAAAEGRDRLPWFLSYRAAYRIARFAERGAKILRRRDYLLSVDAVVMSDIFRELDNGKARRELDWNPRPLEETVRDTVRWFAARADA